MGELSRISREWRIKARKAMPRVVMYIHRYYSSMYYAAFVTSIHFQETSAIVEQVLCSRRYLQLCIFSIQPRYRPYIGIGRCIRRIRALNLAERRSEMKMKCLKWEYALNRIQLICYRYCKGLLTFIIR